MPDTKLIQGGISIPRVDRRVLNLVNPNIENGPWIAGGSVIRWMQGLSMNSFSDVDVFFHDQQQFHRLDQQLQQLIFREYPNEKYTWFDNKIIPLVQHEDNPACQQLFRSDNAITYSWYGYRIQLINRSYYDNVDELLSAFDIIACKIATDGRHWVTNHVDTIDHIQYRVLDMAEPLQPGAIKRFFKYWIYGFQPVPDLITRLQQHGNLETNFANSNDYDHI